MVEVRVRENGVGIPPEIKGKLFQPFFTTKATGEGTGLGLSISYDIVTQEQDDFARQRQELEFRSSLGTVLQSVKGYAADETGRNLARARKLWEQLGSPSEFLQVSYAQSIYHAVRGELKLAHRLDEDLLRLSRQRNEPVGLFLAHQSRGRNLMFAGRLVAARSHLEKSRLHSAIRIPTNSSNELARPG